MENFAEIQKALNQINLPHYIPGLIRQRLERVKAEQFRDIDELRAIYHLTESHAPEFRFKSLLQYYKSCNNDQEQSLFEDCLGFSCNGADTDNDVNSLLKKLSEMPKQWTIVQLTSQISVQQSIEINNEKFYTNPIDLTLFECGTNRRDPILIKINEPRDTVDGRVIELAQEMYSIIGENKGNLMFPQQRRQFFSSVEKQEYYSRRIALDDRLKKVVQDIQKLWLKHWRCLLIGKFVNEQLETEISNRIVDYFKNELSIELKPKILTILICIVKGCHFLKSMEIKSALLYCFPDMKNMDVVRDSVEFLTKLNSDLSLSTQKHYPVILIIDDNLDLFPWEMLDVLADEPVSRAPLFHLIYLLFKTYENSIVDGYRIVNNPKNGCFILNPDLDLKSMEIRMSQFFNYWLPEWRGIIGKKPTIEEFNDLTSCDIFSYMGHGSGTHLITTDIIQNRQINAIVLLFGCGSTKLNKIGPQVQMYGHHQLYLMAKSPCVVGMLWEVTDVDTDLLTTEILSNAIPCPNKTHWSCVDKSTWKKGENVDFDDVVVVTKSLPPYEPDLLRILSISKKAKLYYSTKAACVARGIPVKFQQID